jgi:hypothetical protein
LILAPEQARLVLAGKKTQMRVPITQPKNVTRPNGTSYLSTPQTFPVGKPHTLRSDLHVIVTDTAIVTLGDITQRDAIAEGHKTTDAFRVWWVSTHDKPWVNRYVLKHDSSPSEDMAVARFHQHHAQRDVWAITFMLDREQKPRFLAPTGHGDELGYTSTAAQGIPHEPQAVDEFSQARISADAREMDALRAAGVAERDLDRLRALDVEIAHWRMAGPGVRDHVRQLQRGRAGLERRLREQVRNRQQAA